MQLPFNQPTDKTCSHACLALMVEKPVQYVIDWFGDYGDMAMDGTSSLIFLAHHGIFLAVFAVPKNGGWMEFDPDDSIELGWPVGGRPALLTVQSERFEGKLHSVFWDGEKVFDPSPLSTKCREIAEYKIVEYWPLLVNDITAKRFPIKIDWSNQSIHQDG